MENKQNRPTKTLEKIYVYRDSLDPFYLLLKKTLQHNEEFGGKVIVTDNVDALLDHPLLIINTSEKENYNYKKGAKEGSGLIDLISKRDKKLVKKIVALIPGKHPLEDVKFICKSLLIIK